MDWQFDDDTYEADVPPAPSTKAAVICDDFTAAIRAMRVIGDLGDQWGFWLDPVVWEVLDLETEPSQRCAMGDLADADFIVISVSHPKQVPGSVDKWLKQWLSSQRARSTTQLTQAGKHGGWTITFADVHGVLTARPEIPAFLRDRATSVKGRRQRTRRSSRS